MFHVHVLMAIINVWLSLFNVCDYISIMGNTYNVCVTTELPAGYDESNTGRGSIHTGFTDNSFVSKIQLGDNEICVRVRRFLHLY